jgi:hypothetical protein
MGNLSHTKLDVDFLQQYASLRGSEARQGRNCIGMGTSLVEEQVEEIWKHHHNTKIGAKPGQS